MAIASRQHPLLLWLEGAGFEGSLSLGAYYLLLFACGWFVLRRGRAWARSRSFLVGSSKKSEGGDGVDVSDKAPQLSYVDSPRNRRLLARTTLLARPYKPSPWLGHRLGGHMQSFMFATWCPPADRAMVSRLVTRQDQVESSFDGGAFRMDWFDLKGTPLPADAPVVFVLPGVVGQGTNVYIRHLAAHVSTKYGWRVVTKNWRGIGLELSTRRPETWDNVAVSDTRDAIRHIRRTVGGGVPVLGVGFSFGGCMLTAIAGSVPQEEHGLCGLVSISGLFDMAAMMRHIAEQYAYPYGFANTKVTVKNYRKFKVLETLTAEADVSGGGRSSANSSSNSSSSSSKGSSSDDALVGVGGSSLSLSSSSSRSTGLMRTRKTLHSSAAAAAAAAESAEPAGATAMPMLLPVATAAVTAPSSSSSLPSTTAAAAAAAATAASPPKLVTAKEMAAMKDPTAFHEALTLPFTGDASVDAYFQRIDGIMSKDVASVTVPTLCLLAKDDPLCPPHAWVGALEAAAKSEGIVVAVTEHGGHCGWFDGLGAGSWLDRAAGDFLASALELSKESPLPPSSPSPASSASDGGPATATVAAVSALG
eukprot:g13206.t1